MPGNAGHPRRCQASQALESGPSTHVQNLRGHQAGPAACAIHASSRTTGTTHLHHPQGLTPLVQRPDHVATQAVVVLTASIVVSSSSHGAARGRDGRQAGRHTKLSLSARVNDTPCLHASANACSQLQCKIDARCVAQAHTFWGVVCVYTPHIYSTLLLGLHALAAAICPGASGL